MSVELYYFEGRRRRNSSKSKRYYFVSIQNALRANVAFRDTEKVHLLTQVGVCMCRNSTPNTIVQTTSI